MTELAAICVDHPGEAATSTCARCGQFTCANCPQSKLGDGLYCVACAKRLMRELFAEHRTGLLMLSIRTVSEPVLHWLAMLTGLVGATGGLGWMRRFSGPFALLELLMLATSILTAWHVIKWRRGTLVLVPFQLFVTTCAIVAGSVTAAIYFGPRVGIVMGVLLLAVDAWTAIPILRLVRSPPVRESFVR